MTTTTSDDISPQASASQLYRTAANEWGRWGATDEIGRANLLDPAAVLAASRLIRTGRRFSLALPLCSDGGDPCLPGRAPAQHVVIQAEDSYRDGRVQPLAGGMKYVDDRLELACHGTTHMDALAHAYADSTIWNGYPAQSSADGIPTADVAALARQGVVGRAVLVDLARAEGIDYLPMGREITVADIEAVLAAQQTELAPGDTLILRTGIFRLFYEQGPEAYYANLAEPGLSDPVNTVEFVRRHQVAGLGSDTVCNEQAHSHALDADFPLHVLLQRNLGVIFHEAMWLEEWAADCAEDGVYDAFYVAMPLRLIGGSGAPMNPLVIK
jgi:kynurenine formamidase